MLQPLLDLHVSLLKEMRARLISPNVDNNSFLHIGHMLVKVTTKKKYPSLCNGMTVEVHSFIIRNVQAHIPIINSMDNKEAMELI